MAYVEGVPYSSVQDLINAGYGGYQGWSDLEALYNFRETGGAGKESKKTSSQSADQFANDLISAAKKQVEDETKYLKETFQDNPFAFDEELARKSATAEYEPYYSELLEDYLVNIDKLRETTRDEQKLAKSLYELDAGEKTRAYSRAVAGAEEGFAGSGMFFSGIKQRVLGEGEVEYKAEGERRGKAFEVAQKGFQRQLGTYDTEEERKERDIEREKKTAIEGGILQRESEQEKAYYEPRLASYYRRFPTTTNNLAGYIPADYLRV